jgi:CheY-like chemotaxis protein
VPGARILIVEDEAVVAADLTQQLTQSGYCVDGVANTGEDALRLAFELLPDLVLMDVRLRGTMDGTEAARQIQQRTGTPVVYLTAYPGVFIQDPSRMRPTNLCVAKPFSVSELRTVIETALESKDSAARPV